jgi:hypothetical protein
MHYLQGPPCELTTNKGGLAKRLLQNSLHFQPKTHGQARFKIVLWVAQKKNCGGGRKITTFSLVLSNAVILG